MRAVAMNARLQPAARAPARGWFGGPGCRTRPSPRKSLPLLACVLTALLCACAPRQRPALPWADARQLVLVVTPDWDAHGGTLQAFSRAGDAWRASAPATPVAIGRAGSAWGIGEHPPQPGPVKREGDGRSPAGVFAIGSAFGYAPAAATALPYRALASDDYCIDVSGSPLYNRLVAAHEAGAEAVAGSTEPMRRDLHANGDDAYRIGFVIEHNPAGTPNAGSCIFVHLWKGPGSSTSGCTALDEPALRALLQWLDPRAHPVFVLLPRAEYLRLQAAWRLPAAAAADGSGP